MSRLDVVVVEDEPAIRRELVEMLSARPSVSVVGEAGDLAGAAALLESATADAVFLDIELRGRSGFQLLEYVPERTRVVFVTSYEEHAVRAFQVNAVDYILKPVTEARLDDALDRLRAPTDPYPQGGEGHPLGLEDHLFLRLDSSWGFLRVGDIRCILAEGDYTRVVKRSGEAYLVTKPMAEWERRLPGSIFLRIHRSSLVNLREVERVEDRSDASCLIHLRGADRPLSMSRRYAARIRERLG